MKTIGGLRGKSRLLALGVVLILTIVGMVSGVGMSATDTPRVAPRVTWPKFTMTMRVWAEDYAPGPTPGFTTYKIDYGSLTEWRVEVVEDSYQPDKGSWSSYDGTTLRTHLAEVNFDSKTPASGPIAPFPWLVPGLMQHLKSQSGWNEFSDKQGNTVLSRAQRTDNGNVAEEEYVFDKWTGIPLRVTKKLGGRIREQVTVEELKLLE